VFRCGLQLVRGKEILQEHSVETRGRNEPNDESLWISWDFMQNFFFLGGYAVQNYLKTLQEQVIFLRFYD